MEKRDFSADLRLIWISFLAMPIGILCALLALMLQRLIGLFTNIFYYSRFEFPAELLSPVQGVQALGWLSVLIPVVGGLIIGLMARYGSERIRGHGIPEAMEAILIGKSRMQPKVAVLKPLSSAISIGSGGPFGAEGPIIMTGGACGSIIAQIFHLTSAERKTLLVAGAAGGMSATFGTPIAAVLLAVELLLFEWKPRSLVPVALASAVAAGARTFFPLEPAPIFHVADRLTSPGTAALLSSFVVGLIAGCLSLGLTAAVYAAEDAFHRLPIHWMWWPAIGGVVIGLGGLIQPQALGVGYDNIQALLAGHYPPSGPPDVHLIWPLLALLVVKCVIWSVSLGSGTSGGVLAPLLIMGGALGAIESYFLPGGDARLWPLVGMAAVMGGTMRSPLTGALFGLELTYDMRALLPLLIGSVVAHCFTVLVMKRSILTEKVARRGFHVSREYSVDPLERLTVGEVMTEQVVIVPATLPVSRLLNEFFYRDGQPKHQGYPVVDEKGTLFGVVTRSSLLAHWVSARFNGSNHGGPLELDPIITYDLIDMPPVTAFPWETCRTAAERMAQTRVGRLPIVSSEEPGRLVGIVTRSDLLVPRAKQVEEEAMRERFLGPRLFSFGQQKIAS
jgi:H+/Cl- antiporter ClcA